MKIKSIIIWGLWAAGSVSILHSADPAPNGEDRVRDALRQTMLQLRTAQSDLAALQANQAGLEEDKRVLGEKYDTLRKQIAEDRAAADKGAAGFAAQVSELKAALARRTAELESARAAGDKATLAARRAEAQGAKLNEQNIVLNRQVADREAKNLSLFILGNEILGRYEEFTLGNALRAKEPFVGLTRTKLENLVQDYQDKLADQRVKP